LIIQQTKRASATDACFFYVTAQDKSGIKVPKLNICRLIFAKADYSAVNIAKSSRVSRYVLKRSKRTKNQNAVNGGNT